MIFQEGGRWRSEPSVDESRKELEELLDKLSPEERLAVQHVLNEIDEHGSSATADVCTELEWEETPLPIEEWITGLLYFTGSKQFNIMMRIQAKKLGYNLNEHELYNIKTGKKVILKDEKELFKILKMEYFPPDKR